MRSERLKVRAIQETFHPSLIWFMFRDEFFFSLLTSIAFYVALSPSLRDLCIYVYTKFARLTGMLVTTRDCSWSELKNYKLSIISFLHENMHAWKIVDNDLTLLWFGKHKRFFSSTNRLHATLHSNEPPPPSADENRKIQFLSSSLVSFSILHSLAISLARA